MDENSDEENWVEVGDWTRRSNDSSPEEGHGEVSRIVGLAAVLPPSTDQEFVATAIVSDIGLMYPGVDSPMLCLNEVWLCNRPSWKLWECLTVCKDTLLLHLEPRFL